MRRTRPALVLGLLFALAPARPSLAGGRVVIAFDASLSMRDVGASGKPRIEEAKAAVASVAPGFASGDSGIGLVAFGHLRFSCEVRTLVNVGPGNSDAVTLAVRSIQPAGYTPLAKALEEAARNLGAKRRPGNGDRIILLTDGLETCGGDPRGMAASLRVQYPGLKIHVIGFSTSWRESQRLRDIAVAGGGSMQVANTGASLSQALSNVLSGAYIPDAMPVPEMHGKAPIMDPESLPSEVDFGQAPAARKPDLSPLEAEVPPEPKPEPLKAAPAKKEDGPEPPDNSPGKKPPEPEMSPIPMM